MTSKATGTRLDPKVPQARASIDGAAIRLRLEHAFGDRNIEAMERSIIESIVIAWTESEND